MYRPLDRDAVQPDGQVPTPARKRGVVGRLEIDVHRGEDRPHKALRLAQGQTEDKSECHRGADREIREPLLPARLTRRRRSPRVPRIGRQPQRHVASLDQRSVVCRPIPDVVFRLVLRLNPRLHSEIVRHGPSIRPGPRRSPTGAKLRSRAPTPRLAPIRHATRRSHVRMSDAGSLRTVPRRRVRRGLLTTGC